MTCFKLAVGLMTGSLALISEGIHSLLDFLVTLVTWFSVTIADIPPDEQHHYGHGKVENLSAFAEAILLLGTAVFIFIFAIESLISHKAPPPGPTWWIAIGVIVVSIFVDFSRSLALRRAAKKFNSQALEADALHFSTELLSSVAVLSGLLIYKLAGKDFAWADPVAAIVVACIMLYTSGKLGKRAADVLVDRAPERLERRLAATIRRVPGVCDVRRVRARQSGANTFVDATITVDRTLALSIGHQIADTVEHAVTESFHNLDIVVHVEPADAAGDEAAAIRDLASGMALRVHAIRVRSLNGQLFINFHTEVAPTMTIADAHQLVTELEDRIRRRLPQVAEIDSHLEPAVET